MDGWTDGRTDGRQQSHVRNVKFVSFFFRKHEPHYNNCRHRLHNLVSDAFSSRFQFNERLDAAQLRLPVRPIPDGPSALLCFQFVAHSHSQQMLMSVWYMGLPLWRGRNPVLKVLMCAVIVLLIPLLSVLYLLFPRSRVGRAIRSPFMKFIYHRWAPHEDSVKLADRNGSAFGKNDMVYEDLNCESR